MHTNPRYILSSLNLYLYFQTGEINYFKACHDLFFHWNTWPILLETLRIVNRVNFRYHILHFLKSIMFKTTVRKGNEKKISLLNIIKKFKERQVVVALWIKKIKYHMQTCFCSFPACQVNNSDRLVTTYFCQASIEWKKRPNLSLRTTTLAPSCLHGCHKDQPARFRFSDTRLYLFTPLHKLLKTRIVNIYTPESTLWSTS